MEEKDMESRKFWKKIITIVTLTVFIGVSILAWNIVKLFSRFDFVAYLFVFICPGVPAYVNYIFNKELDRRFPPFDPEDSKFPTFRGELNYQSEQDRKKQAGEN